jgi:hypothetical protein
MRPAYSVLEAARGLAEMSHDELWLAYFALGGTASPEAVRAYLEGNGGSIDYDVLAQAINERFLDMGQNHPVPYMDELDPAQR